MTDLDKLAVIRLNKKIKKLEKRIIVLEQERTKLLEWLDKLIEMPCA
tara:strand:- start:309 stop:449 length:141 start_codon:yes stop_codon:yes gene_type:complete